jgi:hypothetical protein
LTAIDWKVSRKEFIMILEDTERGYVVIHPLDDIGTKVPEGGIL